MIKELLLYYILCILCNRWYIPHSLERERCFASRLCMQQASAVDGSLYSVHVVASWAMVDSFGFSLLTHNGLPFWFVSQSLLLTFFSENLEFLT